MTNYIVVEVRLGTNLALYYCEGEKSDTAKSIKLQSAAINNFKTKYKTDGKRPGIRVSYSTSPKGTHLHV